MRSLLSSLALVLACVTLCPPAWAQPGPLPSPIELGKQGLSLMEAGDWAQALSTFQQAEAASHSPVFLLYIGRCQTHLGRLFEARASYERVVAEKLPAEPPPSWQQAQIDAKSELVALKARIPSVVVAVKNPPDGAVLLSVAGKAIKAGEPVELEPGEHDITASSGKRSSTRRVVLKPGEQNVPVVIDFAPVSPGPEGGVGGTTGPEPEPGSLLPGGIVLGVGIVSLIAGAVTGGLALSTAGEVHDACPNGECPVSRKSEIDDKVSEANTLGHTSTATLIAGAAIASTGIFLMVLRPGGSSAPPAKAGAVWIAPTWSGAVVVGRF